jgi:hypothetical protein
MTVAFAQLVHASTRSVSSSRARSTMRARQDGFLRRLFGRRTPSLYQRCLAVHIAGAAKRSALR